METIFRFFQLLTYNGRCQSSPFNALKNRASFLNLFDNLDQILVLILGVQYDEPYQVEGGARESSERLLVMAPAFNLGLIIGQPALISPYLFAHYINEKTGRAVTLL